MSDTDRQGLPGAGPAAVVDQPLRLVDHRVSVGSAEAEFGAAAPYHDWGWPVTHCRAEIQLSLDGEVSAIAIPVALSAGVTRELTFRHCTPAVLSHPHAAEHHIVLAGERFGAPLPWPPEVYQVDGPLTLPPTVTPDETPDRPITWVQPPNKDSLRLAREIDVFGALRAVLDD